MIEVRDLHMSFGETAVLKGISAFFEAGKTSLIIGASGSGKSTLARCMVGLIKPTAGEILYDDRSFLAMDNTQKKALRTEIGFLFQGSALLSHRAQVSRGFAVQRILFFRFFLRESLFKIVGRTKGFLAQLAKAAPRHISRRFCNGQHSPLYI